MARQVNKNVRVFEYELPLKVEALEEGGFLATSKALQGVLAEGETVSEAIANAIEVAAAIIETREEEGLSNPLKLIKKRAGEVYQTQVTIPQLA